MKSDLNDLKKLTMELMQNGTGNKVQETNKQLIQKIYGNQEDSITGYNELPSTKVMTPQPIRPEPVLEQEDDDDDDNYLFAETVEEEETLRLDAKEIELIKKALERNKGKRKAAADELGISERTLYRKIKQFDL